MNLKQVLETEKKPEYHAEKVSAALGQIRLIMGDSTKYFANRPYLAVELCKHLLAKGSANELKQIASRINSLSTGTRSHAEKTKWDKFISRVLDGEAVKLHAKKRPEEVLATLHAAFADPASLYKAAQSASTVKLAFAERAYSVGQRLEHGRTAEYYPVNSDEHEKLSPNHSVLTFVRGNLALKLHDGQETLITLAKGSPELTVLHSHGETSGKTSIEPVMNNHEPGYLVSGRHAVVLRPGMSFTVGPNSFHVKTASKRKVVLEGKSGSVLGRKLTFSQPKEVYIGSGGSSHIRLFHRN